ncbi:MAG: 3-isopropylmalate dehydratase small subunit [Pseudomonadales bacterium]|nr:3-isopropylmalate dehydratase small subunit [Pseudomonadales bacterium]
MQAFTKHSGFAVPLERVNVDTDQIIPKQFLKSIKRTGFGDYLFDAWRFNDAGDLGMTPNERAINHEFVLNESKYQGASILLAGENFGCGSSREHAVWALLEYGFSVVIAPSFADIFYGNCFKNGLLPIVLNGNEIDALVEAAKSGQNIAVDLSGQSVSFGEQGFQFDIAAGLKEKMLSGMDDIAATIAEREKIEAFEVAHRQNQPWLFSKNKL